MTLNDEIDAMRRRAHAEIDEWRARLALMKAQSRQADADLREAWGRQVEDLGRQMEEVDSRLRALGEQAAQDFTESAREAQQATINQWSDIRARLERVGQALVGLAGGRSSGGHKTGGRRNVG